MADEVLFIDDDDRYARFRLIAWWEQEKLTAARILVVGAGALGNEVLKNLALLGVGSVHIVDFDEIEGSNLSRSVLFRSRDRGRSKAEAAAEAVMDIYPEIKVQALCANVITDIGLGLFRDVDVVIGCLDNREARLWVNRQCWKVNTPWIDAGIQEINGVVKVFVPPDSACYECAMTENDYRLINLRYSCPLLRQEDIQAGKVPTAPTISSMMAALQTQEALKLLHGIPVVAGRAMVYNGLTNNFYKTDYQRRNDCLSHETYPEPVELPLSARRNTARDLFAALHKRLNDQTNMRLSLDRDLVVSLNCTECGHSQEVLRPLQLVGMREAVCSQCGKLSRPVLEHTIDEDSPLAEKTLAQLGVPPYDMVRVATDQGEQVVLLADDRGEFCLPAQ